MGWLTRLVLHLLGWRSSLCRDHRGVRYEAWTRRTWRGGPVAYFDVYREKRAGGWDRVVR